MNLQRQTRLNNILRGILPTAAGWDSAPANLSNVTDGNVATVSGIGSTTIGGNADIGTVTFDLGSVKTFLFGIRLGRYSTASTSATYIHVSDDNVNWRPGITVAAVALHTSITSVTEEVFDIPCLLCTGRYILIRCRGGAAQTGYAKFYEAVAYELQL